MGTSSQTQLENSPKSVLGVLRDIAKLQIGTTFFLAKLIGHMVSNTLVHDDPDVGQNSHTC